MKNARNFLTRLIVAAAVLGLGMVYSAKADDVSFTSTVYYAGPSGDPTSPPDNPYGVTNAAAGGNPISGFALTSTGAQGTLTFNTSGTPGVEITSATPGLFTVDLYGTGNGSTPLVVGGVLQAGTYTFDSSSDYFGIATSGGTTGFGCTTGQACNAGSNPQDITTITVGPNGLVTVSSSSLELVAAISNTPTGAPEVDPKNAMVPFALLGGLVLIFRGRRAKSAEVAV